MQRFKFVVCSKFSVNEIIFSILAPVRMRWGWTLATVMTSLHNPSVNARAIESLCTGVTEDYTYYYYWRSIFSLDSFSCSFYHVKTLRVRGVRCLDLVGCYLRYVQIVASRCVYILICSFHRSQFRNSDWRLVSCRECSLEYRVP